eukprot:3905650-Rhodomonas_salina.1
MEVSGPAIDHSAVPDTHPSQTDVGCDHACAGDFCALERARAAVPLHQRRANCRVCARRSGGGQREGEGELERDVSAASRLAPLCEDAAGERGDGAAAGGRRWGNALYEEAEAVAESAARELEGVAGNAAHARRRSLRAPAQGGRAAATAQGGKGGEG